MTPTPSKIRASTVQVPASSTSLLPALTASPPSHPTDMLPLRASSCCSLQTQCSSCEKRKGGCYCFLSIYSVPGTCLQTSSTRPQYGAGRFQTLYPRFETLHLPLTCPLTCPSPPWQADSTGYRFWGLQQPATPNCTHKDQPVGHQPAIKC